MTTYPGIPAPRLGVHLSREDSRRANAPRTRSRSGRASPWWNT
ncbi:hypothetical protein ABGB18_21410 [Nonomuraea sp. B12E4]